MDFTNSFDAFDAGVAPGGLRNTTQIKILINVLLRNSGQLPQALLTEALGLHGLVNYFEAAQAIDDLRENGNLVAAEGLLSVTPKGILAADELRAEVPRSVLETATADLLYLQTQQRRSQENAVEILPAENGCHVRIRVADPAGTLMELTVYAADQAQAERLRENFLRDPSHVYATVVASLFI
ncbi:MAG: DUF4364 family protein [Clostridia bacterium]|nr:DUF4364 family protein [Clostridia bacterium]